MAQHNQGESTEPSQGGSCAGNQECSLCSFSKRTGARRTTHRAVPKSWHKHHTTTGVLLKTAQTEPETGFRCGCAHLCPVSNVKTPQGSATVYSASAAVLSCRKTTLSGEGITELLLSFTCICFTARQQDK